MRKVFLTITWAIIISGSIFLIINKIKTNYLSKNDSEITSTKIVRNTLATTVTDNIDISTNIDPIENIDTQTNITNSNKTADYIAKVKEADSLFEQKKYEEAIKLYEEALLIQNNSTETLKKLGISYMKIQKYADSYSTFEKASEIAPKSNEIKLYLAKNLLNMNRNEEAKKIIWELPNTYLEAKYYQAITLIIYEKELEAQSLFEEIVNTENVSEELKTKSQIFLDQYIIYNNYTEEGIIFLKTILANALVQNEEYELAITELFEIITDQSNYRDAWLILGYSYLKTNQIQDAIDALNQAKELDPKKSETLFLLGLSYYLNDEYEKAIFYLEKAKTEGFSNKDLINIKLAEIYKIKEKYEKSAQIYEELLANEIYTIEIFKNLSSIYLDEFNDISKTEKLALKALELFPKNAETYYIIGKTNLYKKDIERAEEYLKEAIRLNPKYDESYLDLGKIYESKKEYLLAQEYYKLANFYSQNEETSRKSTEAYNVINTLLSNKNYQVNLQNL